MIFPTGARRDNVSERRFAGVEDLMRLCRATGLEIRWFDRKPVLARDQDGGAQHAALVLPGAARGVRKSRPAGGSRPAASSISGRKLAHKVLHGGEG